GVTLSWVGTGRCLSSMDMTGADYDELTDKLTKAARAMKRDAWWLTLEQYPEKEKRMKVRLAREMAASLVPGPVKTFYTDVIQRKHDDHHASHNDWANQALHVVSSSVFIYCYAVIFKDLTSAMCWGLGSLFVRQFGHAILEPACHDEEMLLLGYTTREKTLIVLGYAVLPMLDIFAAGGRRAADASVLRTGGTADEEPRHHRAALVPVDGVRGRASPRLPRDQARRADRDGVVREAGLGSGDRPPVLCSVARPAPARDGVKIDVLIWSALLLALERGCYVWAWRAPDPVRPGL